jgi:hypothetical protein
MLAQMSEIFIIERMRKERFFLCLILLIVTYAFCYEEVYAQNITELNTLDFGQFVPDPNGGTIEKDTGFGRSNIVGNASFIGFLEGSRGRFRITGDSSRSVDIDISSSVLTGPGDPLTIDNFSGSTSFFGGGSYLPITANINFFGFVSLNIGAELTYAAGQLPGIYSGTFTIRYKYSSDSVWKTFTSTATAHVMPLDVSVTEVQSLDFGTILPELTGGIVRVDNNGNISNIFGNSMFYGGAQNAEFLCEGIPNSPLNVSVSSGVLTGPGADMIIDGFTVQPPNPSLWFTGRRTITVGARLNINPNQQPGFYSGTYTIDVSY